MQALGFRQPSAASAQFYKLCAQLLLPASKRHQSSYRRARSKLNIKPDPSFLPTTTEVHDHIIYNPPSSMPNVLHTPTIFLPKNDRRIEIRAALATSTSPVASISSPQKRLPPPVRKPYQKRYHVTEDGIMEMRRLRKEDATKWSITQLAKKFDCSKVFVSFATDGLSKEKKAQQQLVTETVKSRWGPKRRIAREDRTLRRERWYRDE